MNLINSKGDKIALDSRFDVKLIEKLIASNKHSEIDDYLSTIKGYPTHEQGGVDIKLGEEGVSFARDSREIKAKHGLVLPTIKAQNGLVVSKYEPTKNVKDKNTVYYSINGLDKVKNYDILFNAAQTRKPIKHNNIEYLSDLGEDDNGRYISFYRKDGAGITGLFTPDKEYYDRLYLPKDKYPTDRQAIINKEKIDFKNNVSNNERKGAYVKGKSEAAFNNITPQGYGDLFTNLDRYKRLKNNLGRDKNETMWYSKEESSTGKDIYYNIPKRDDAFLLYLGMPQKNNSFEISDYAPTISNDKNKIYYRPTYNTNIMKQALVDDYFTFEGSNRAFNERGSSFKIKTDSLKQAGVPWENPITAEWVMDNPLGDFKLSKGEDNNGHYISLYDSWDLNPFQDNGGASRQKDKSVLKYLQKLGYDANENTEISSLFGAGKPFEIYDRIYYNPETKKIIIK